RDAAVAAKSRRYVNPLRACWRATLPAPAAERQKRRRGLVGPSCRAPWASSDLEPRLEVLEHDVGLEFVPLDQEPLELRLEPDRHLVVGLEGELRVAVLALELPGERALDLALRLLDDLLVDDVLDRLGLAGE